MSKKISAVKKALESEKKLLDAHPKTKKLYEQNINLVNDRVIIELEKKGLPVMYCPTCNKIMTIPLTKRNSIELAGMRCARCGDSQMLAPAENVDNPITSEVDFNSSDL